MNKRLNLQSPLSGKFKGVQEAGFWWLLLCAYFFLPLTANAQVKIGEEELPTQGAVLDMKKTTSTADFYRGGFLLPHVEIKDLRYIPATFTDANKMEGYDADKGVDTNTDLTGLLVYNTVAVTNIPVGVYRWRGKDWVNVSYPDINGGGHLSEVFDATVTGYDLANLGECGAYIDNGRWLRFMCYNLGADTSLDPFVPAAGLHGAKYRFGIKEPLLTMAEDQIDATETGDWSASDWAALPVQVNGDWSEENDPCPAGWRLPFFSELKQMRNCTDNTQKWILVGEYTSGRHVGKRLFFPAAGFRDNNKTGRIRERGVAFYNWGCKRIPPYSGQNNGNDYGHALTYNNGNGNMGVSGGHARENGFSVRCVKK